MCKALKYYIFYNHKIFIFWYSFWRVYAVLIQTFFAYKPAVMKNMKQNLFIVSMVTLAGVVGFFLGSEAKQKWISKFKHRYDNRKHLAQQKSFIRKGGVLLDDIELEAYHN